MNKKSFLFITFMLAASLLPAEIIETQPVGPGVHYYHDFLENGPWNLFILEIDMTNPWLDFETAKAGNRLAGYEQTSSMSARNDYEKHRVMGAVNGDFYEAGGIPTNAQVLRGVLLKKPITREALAFTPDNDPLISVFTFGGTLIPKNRSQASINGINESRGDGKLIVYNKYFGASTGTNETGTEIITEYLNTPMVNDTMLLKVVRKDSITASGHGNNTIPANGVVLSGNGNVKVLLDSQIFVGDTVRLVLRLAPPYVPVKELVGGSSKIIDNGLPAVPSGSFSSDRHPRTAVGFSEDSTKLYFVVVDGRQTGYSVGMSLYELANYMLTWNVQEAINLDGGGSSTMVVRNKVKNSPSDSGGERSVANALLLISKAPTSDLAHLLISRRVVYLLTGNGFKFSVSGFDEYYNPVSIMDAGLQWDCDAGLGSIDNQGNFTATTDTSRGYVYVSTGAIRDSVRVFVTNLAKITLTPNPIILKQGEKQQITAEAVDYFDNIIALDNSEYIWEISNNIGEISSSGLFTASGIGEGVITATYNSVVGSTSVSIGATTRIILDNFDSVASWTLTGSKVNLNECGLTLAYEPRQSLPSSGKLDYSLTTGGTSALYLECSIPISGSPDAIGLWVFGDGKGHWLRGEFQDKDGEKFLINFTALSPGIDWSDSWKYIEIPFSEAEPSWANSTATMEFPVTWKRIYLAETDDAKKDKGAIYFDDFCVSFIQTKLDDSGQLRQLHNFELHPNYPNPFNNQTLIKYGIRNDSEVLLGVYDLRGNLIDTLIDKHQRAGNYSIHWAPQNVSSGTCLVRIVSGEKMQTEKVMLLK